MHSVCALGVTSNAGQDLVRGFGPNEGLGIFVVDVDVLTDGGFQVLHAAENTPSKSLVGKFSEPSLHQIDPRTVSVAWDWRGLVVTARWLPAAMAKQLLSHFDTSLRKSALAEEWLGKGFTSQTIGTVLQSLSKQLSFKPRDFGKKAVGLAENLMELERTSEERVGAAVVLLLVCASYWKSSSSDLPERHLHRPWKVYMRAFPLLRARGHRRSA